MKIPVALRMLEQYGRDITLCPKCKQGRLQLIAIIYPWQSVVKIPGKTIGTGEQIMPRNKASPQEPGQVSPKEKVT